MKKLVLAAVLLVSIAYSAFAQQDPMFTKYMFNSLAFNPAYAGSKGFMDVGLLYRDQWLGFEGAPTTQSFWLHSPLKSERVGLGLNIIHDQIGATRTITANASYAYRIPLNAEDLKLAIGVQGGIANWRADWGELDIRDPNDPAYVDPTPTVWLPNFGLGLYLSNQLFYVGASVPHVIDHDLRRDNITTERYARQYRHIFFHGGMAIPLSGDDIIFKPSFLIKNVGLFGDFRGSNNNLPEVGAPTEFDIDLSVQLYRTLWVGASFRAAFEAFNDKSSIDSGDVWAQYRMKNGLRVGAAWDFTLTKINKASNGSFELMLGYEFDYKKDRIVTPRYPYYE